MLVRKRRIVEDWSADLSDSSSDSERGLVAKARASGRLWLMAAAIVVGICAILVLSAYHMDRKTKKVPPRVIGKPVGSYTDSQHAQFMRILERRERQRGVDITARYVSNTEIHITVPPDISSDEVAAIIRFAGLGTMNRFGAFPNILIYSSGVPGGPPNRLVAIARWSLRDNDFNIEFKKD